VLLPILTLLVAGGAHPESLSRTRIHVEGPRATVELRFQALSLLEVLPELDTTPDGELDAREAEAARERIEDYLLEALRLSAVVEGREVPLAGALVALVPGDPSGFGPFDLQGVDARLVYAGTESLGELVIESRLFHAMNPWHKDLTSVAWNADAPVPHTFEGDRTRWHFRPAHVRRPGVLVLFLRLGVDHILSGFDHQAFLLALLVASRRLRTLVAVVTAFTAAHSLTLAAAALGWVEVPARLVELAIALSIAYVGTDNLLRPAPRNPWPEAFVFGLLHGLGFAGFLADALTGEALLVTALFGFNLGVELGQLALVLACVAVLALVFRRWRRTRADPASGLAPPGARTVISAGVALSGFYWFLERAGWLPWA
jgi:hydrogenase/urease accessory protein HupE